MTADQQPETIGQLYDRVPPTWDWVYLPEYGIRVRRWADPETVQIVPDATQRERRHGGAA